MPDKLFVYGTLHPDRAPAEIAQVVKRFEPLGFGSVRGRLYRFREYPAMKIDSKNGTRIPGEVFRIPSAKDLIQLDKYEEYDPSAVDSSLFQRKKVNVRMNDGTSASCWVYEYNRQLPSATSEEPPPARKHAGRS